MKNWIYYLIIGALELLKVLLLGAICVCFVLPIVCVLTGKGLVWMLLWITVPVIMYVYVKLDLLSDDI